MSEPKRIPLSEALLRTNSLRNVCIIAHIDHGKTTLSDHLIAEAAIGPNVLSKKLAGQARYLDSRKDEQERAITMKASSILLKHNDVLIALTDSPGHVDFSSEVSAAARLADGAVLLIDACEGIAAQTQNVLAQAWKEGLKVVLCINKVDRLIVDLKMTPMDAYFHLRKIIEQINVIASSFFMADIMMDQKDSDDMHLEIDDTRGLTFSPELGNVVFASAVDGWGFTIPSAAKFFASRMNMNELALRKALWGDFYYHAKDKKVLKKPNKSGEPLFVQFLLSNIWRVYNDVLEEKHVQKMKQIVTSLDLKIPPREMLSSDFRIKLQAIMSRWLPLSEAILDMIVDHLPSPLDAQKHRIPKIFDTSRLDEEHRNDFKESIENCNNSASNPTVVFVAKMISTSCTFEDFSENQQPKATAIVRKPYQKGKFLDQKEGSDNASSLDNLEDELLKATIRESENEVTSSKSSSNNMEENQNGEEKDSERFIGFSRVFSGVLDSESDLWATLPKGEKVLIPKGSMKLFIFMGKELLPVLKVPAGVVCGILGIDEYVLSYATLSSEENCPSFNQLSNYSAPILKVAVYPAKADSNSMKSLSNGLKLLSHADANVEVSLEASGENVIVACGELHLERCLTDLKERFCKNLDIRVSEPIVSFIETIGGGSKKAVLEVKATPNKWISFGVKAVNLIPQVYEKNWNIKNEDPDNDEVTDFGYVVLPSPEEIKKLLGQHAELSKLKILRTSANGCNFLAWNNEEMKFFDPSNNENDVLFFREIVSSIMSGFEIAMREGPLCNEPMTGVVILIDQVLLERPENWKDFKDPYGPISGQVISAFKDVCRKACESQTSLLVEGMFKLELQCKSEMLGKLYGFLDQRRGRVIREELFPGTDLFVVEGYLPVAESLGFAREVRQKTRGGANPMLILDHWEVVSDKSVSDKNINSVRRRKGLHVNEQVVEHAEKQRTLKR